MKITLKAYSLQHIAVSDEVRGLLHKLVKILDNNRAIYTGAVVALRSKKILGKLLISPL